MLKNLILVPIIALFGFINVDNVDVVSSKEEVSQEVLQEIEIFNQIIETKKEHIKVLEEQAAILLAHNSNAVKAQAVKEEARRNRMMILKYQAAIACRERTKITN